MEDKHYKLDKEESKKMTGYASIDKPWLKYYNSNNIGLPLPHMKIYEYLYQNNKKNIYDTALIYYGNKISYYEMFEKIEKIAKSLKMLGIKKGDAITIALPTIPETIYLLYAIDRVGAIANVINPLLTEKEIANLVMSTNSKLLFSLSNFSEKLNETCKYLDKDKIITVSATESLPILLSTFSQCKEIFSLNSKEKNKYVSWSNFIKKGDMYTDKIDSNYESNSPISIVYTGGTTGSPKGVVLTNDNFNAMAHMHKYGGYQFKRGDISLNILPPFIAYCLSNSIHVHLCMGLTVILIPIFDAKDFPKLLIKYKPNHVLGGPILWENVIKSKKLKNKKLSFLVNPVSGGDTMNSELESRVNKYLEEHNCQHKVAQGYGMTEACSAVVYSKESANKIGSVGIPFMNNVVSIFNPETLEELKYGEIGEICINTPTLMKCYYNKKEESANVIKVHKDGKKWLHTGDLGIIDSDGNLFIKGRMKRIIVRNGNKIFPADLEKLIMSLEFVESCAVVAMPDESERNVPILNVVLKPDFYDYGNEIMQKINSLIKNNYPIYYLPKKIIIRKTMPLTVINKIDFISLEKDNESLKNNDDALVYYEEQVKDIKIKTLK